MRVCSTLFTLNVSRSLFVSDETFHQKLSVPGPTTVVCIEFEPLLPIVALRAASVPSCDTIVWPSHDGEPFVVHVRFVVSSAVLRGTIGVTTSTAFELTLNASKLLTAIE